MSLQLQAFLFLLRKLIEPLLLLLNITGLCSDLVHPAGFLPLSDACPGLGVSPKDISAMCRQTQRSLCCFPLTPRVYVALPGDLCDIRPGIASLLLHISPRLHQAPLPAFVVACERSAFLGFQLSLSEAPALGWVNYQSPFLCMDCRQSPRCSTLRCRHPYSEHLKLGETNTTLYISHIH